MQVQIAKILDGVPEVSDYLEERIDEIPEEYRAQIGDSIVSLLEVLPTTYIPKLRSGLEEQTVDKNIDEALRVLPSTQSMKGFLKVIDRQKADEENEKRVETQKQSAFKNHATAIR